MKITFILLSLFLSVSAYSNITLRSVGDLRDFTNNTSSGYDSCVEKAKKRAKVCAGVCRRNGGGMLKVLTRCLQKCIDQRDKQIKDCNKGEVGGTSTKDIVEFIF